MNQLLRLKYYLNYQWRAQTKYYLHSPFVYQFYLNVLEGATPAELKPLATLRKQLSANNTPVTLTDLGTGSGKSRKISVLESNVAIRHKYGLLLYHLINYFNIKSVIELGTSMGISSAYMALANSDTTITSLEGAEALAALARQNHQLLGIKNIQVETGNFNTTLKNALTQVQQPGLIFFDGNHTFEATLQYFNTCLPFATENTIFVFDDICWSEPMQRAWQQIKAHPQITLSIDVFQFGICFFRKTKLAKEDFMLRY